MSKSQFYQDIIALHDIYDFKEGGYFVDIGAFDGEYLSNTYVMEKKFKWKGICVEPCPYLFNQLKQTRNCISLHNACGKDKFITVFYYVPIEFKTDIKAYERVGVLESNDKIDIQCKTLQQILDENNAPQFIEYISIDTDGYDYDVISSVDLDKYTFGVINIEHNGKDNQIKKLLESKGYERIYRIYVDDIYIHKSIKPKEREQRFALNFLQQY